MHIYVFGMESRENKTVIIPLIGFRNRDGMFTARYEILIYRVFSGGIVSILGGGSMDYSE